MTRKPIRMKKTDQGTWHTDVVVKEQPPVNEDILAMIRSWNVFAKKYKQKIPRNDRSTKVMKRIESVCSKFLSGHLVTWKEFVPPKFFPVEKKKRTVTDFRRCLKNFGKVLENENHPEKRFLRTRKFSLDEFIAGNNLSGMESPLFRYGYTQQKKQSKLKYPIEINDFIEQWEIWLGKKEFLLWEKIKVDNFLEWGIPHFYDLYSNLTTLQHSFDDHFHVMWFFVFNAMKKFNDPGVTLLNQDFFKDKMEQIRSHHNYTV